MQDRETNDQERQSRTPVVPATGAGAGGTLNVEKKVGLAINRRCDAGGGKERGALKGTGLPLMDL